MAMSEQPDIEILVAETAEDVAACTAIFVAYADSLGFSIAYQGFDAEMAAMPGAYAPPRGVLLLARVDGAPAGAVGLRPSAATNGNLDFCEMKRLYVRPAFRGLGLGRKLAHSVIDLARARDFAMMRLDTLDTMVAACALYTSLGFFAIPGYNDNPLEGAVFFQLPLT